LPRSSRVRLLWTIALLAISGASPALAERQPLAQRGPKLNLKTAEYSIETNAAGDWVMRYQGYDDQPVVVVYAPPNKVEITVIATVERDQIGNFIYGYKLSSGAASKQKLDTFVLEAAGFAAGLKAPKEWRAEILNWLKSAVWHPDYQSEEAELGPGKQLEGFELTVPLHEVSGGTPGAVSYEGAMPGIVHCHAIGDNDVMAFPDEPPGSLEEVLPRYPFDGVSGRTIGPVRVPPGIQFSWILEHLRADLEESLSLHWIADRATLEKYFKLLARFADSMGEPWLKSREKLHSIAKEAEADLEQGNLTTEAFALLGHTSQLLELFLKKT
jgi:hypothetical protein